MTLVKAIVLMVFVGLALGLYLVGYLLKWSFATRETIKMTAFIVVVIPLVGFLFT
jgi:hypothetical protein